MLIFLLIAAFLLSAFFSMSEIIYTVADRIKIRVWSKSGIRSAQKTKVLIKNPDNYLIPILTGNNIANVAYATFFTYLSAENNWRAGHLELTLYITILLVVFAEIIPKMYARRYSDNLSLKLLYPFVAAKTILKPFSAAVGAASRTIMKAMKIPHGSAGWTAITKGDIDVMVDKAAKENTVAVPDALFIKKLLLLGHKKVREIMVHRKNIVAVDVRSPVYRLRKIFRLTSFSRIVIYENDLDDIKGIVFVKDLLSETKTINELVRPVVFVRESTSVLSLFKTLKKEKATVCIAIDEFGGCVGLAAMHDILELIVGRVEDPHDNRYSGRGIIYRKDQRILIVDGSADIEELMSMIGSITDGSVFMPEYDCETANGYITGIIKRIPYQGEVLDIGSLKIRVVKAKKHYIETVIIKL